ncbi:3-oxoacyl-[acyl-carrier-protein] reductase FabG [Pseudocercospora fuligena]|uniref:3-oxoacyl-[acyl-carrier-protein] reductase FabG n=1 Tax=Pseudocercospora fuligena TaxID=685502 RepID=A0A8H6RVH4_9PEZI|nr:3-oxoacyl-[acyl-carrier-protein] reductase FabG [Pseudocercospora fuligena]
MAAKSITSKFSLEGKSYIVTGGAMGIGYCITKDIAESGANVAVLDLRVEPLEDVYGLAKQFGVKADYFQADVSDEKSLTAAFEKAVQSLGKIDGIVTAAGIAIDKPFVDQKWEEVEKVLQVNAMGSFFAAQLAVKQLQKQGTGGSIVFIASITAHVNLPGYRMAGYNVSKGGVKMLSKVLSAELAPKGIRVNSISPAFIETNQTRGAREHTTKAAGDLMQTAPPIGRIGQPDEVSPAAIFFLSDAATYVTGADILVSGGIHTGRGGDYDMV